MDEFKFIPNEYYIEEGRRRFASIADYAIITIDGEGYEYPIAATVERDGFFKHYFEVEDEPVGNIERIELFTQSGASLGSGNGYIEKGDDGWQIAIKLFVVLKEEASEDAGA
ncbi:hypothetical protein [Sporosarcina sp. FSL K6-1508]|uniref:hypothetical protein n=1 Tax=Sporosarcina sp. FSL K6-1508 TaxID=2921553 RepID=UPI0030FC0414